MRHRVDPWLVLSILLLAALSVFGIWTGVGDLRQSETFLQLTTSSAKTGSGILALGAIPALLVGWRGLKTLLRLWLLAISVTGGLAPVAWGEAGAGAGMAGLLLAFCAALAIIWVIRRAQVAP